YLLDGEGLDDDERQHFLGILAAKEDEAVTWGALLELSRLLHRHHGEQVVVLIDEYDTPIHSGFGAGYYDRILVFFRNCLPAGPTDNPHLLKSVLTGVLRVARESIFSGLNGLAVYAVLRPAFSAAFGFTPAEVEQL